MRVLVIGATGMIGEALVAKLLAAGFEVIAGVRDVERAAKRWPQVAVVHVDLADPATASQWQMLLQGVDLVVNTVGIFRESGSQTFAALHVEGPVALFDAAVAAGVRVVQISALGADPHSPARYLSSKGQADDALFASSGKHTVVRPSFVFAPQGASTRWFAMLAALPLTPLPDGGRQRIQPVHLDDLCAAIERLLDAADPPRCVEAVGARAVSLRDYLAYFKRVLRLAGFIIGFPMTWARALAGPLSRVSRLITPEALTMLASGNVGDDKAFAALLGRSPRSFESFIGDAEREAMRRRAQLSWLVPLLRYAVALTWLATGYVSAFVYPEHESLALLARTGLEGAPARVALYGAAAVDVLLGVLTLVPRFRRWSYRGQLFLIGFYTATITIVLPEFWAHPYGPILKNLPLFAAIAALHELDDTRGSPDR